MKETTASLTNEMLLARRNEAIPRGPFNVAPIFVDRARGLGAMCAIEIADAARTGTILREARECGLLLISASGNVVRTLMQLMIPDDQLEEGLGILETAAAAVSAITWIHVEQ